VLALEEIGGNKFLALAWIYEALESDQFQSETIGKYSYQRWKMRGSDRWKMKAATAALAGLDGAPDVALRPGPGTCGGIL
jgi:hypothetical protein